MARSALPKTCAPKTAVTSARLWLRLGHASYIGPGTSFRRYVQWARMIRVGRAYSAGHDLTRAAVDAGFAAPSHFSDTFRAMFGLTPAAFLTVNGELDID